MVGRHDGSIRQGWVVLVVIAGLMSVGKDAFAEPARKGYTRHRNPAALQVDDASAEPEPPQRWYGWQLLIADGSATGLILLAAEMTDGDLPGAVGLLLYASPIVHALHGNPGRAAASLGLRAVLPFAGALIGIEASNSGCGLLGGECEALPTGVVVGYALAVLIDAGLLAWEEDDAPDADASRLRPAVQIGRSGAWLGVAGEL
jgi:hypothetical protein